MTNGQPARRRRKCEFLWVLESAGTIPQESPDCPGLPTKTWGPIPSVATSNRLVLIATPMLSCRRDGTSIDKLKLAAELPGRATPGHGSTNAGGEDE